jgi:amino acid transporter
MEYSIQVQRILYFILFFLCGNASAFGAGDTIALLLGLVIGFFGIFACIGCYAKRAG